jgi:hypothetical protein
MTPQPACYGSYLFHGIGVRVAGSGPGPEFLHHRLASFRSDTPSRPQIVAEFDEVRDIASHSVRRPMGVSRPIYEAPRGEVLYYSGADRVFIDYADRVRVLCDPTHGRMLFSVVAAEENSWVAAHPLFTICWIEVLKRMQLFSVHASAVCHGGKGLLLAGPSGSGKTTLALALLRAGFGFLGDDMTFLRAGPEGVRALSFPDETDVTPETVGMFPELGSAACFKGAPGRRKLAIRAEAVYGASVTEECVPAAIVFPRVVPGSRAVLRPIGEAEALAELSSNVLLTQKSSSQAHLDVLGCLIRQTRCFRIEVERPDEAAAALVDLIAN